MLCYFLFFGSANVTALAVSLYSYPRVVFLGQGGS